MPTTERDWLVTFAHKVASEDARQAAAPGSSWCLMLRKDEAHAVVTQMNELVQQEAESQRVIALCAADTTAADLAQEVEFRSAALVQIIDLAQDEPGGLNFANRAATIAREAMRWEKPC